MARMKTLAVLFSRNLLKIKNGLDELVRKENLSGVLVLAKAVIGTTRSFKA